MMERSQIQGSQEKKGLLASYVAGLTDLAHGESYRKILYYFFPEYITALLLYTLPIWIDSVFISSLQSTTIYATLGTTNNLIHFIVKLAEALSVGPMILSGQFNGMKQHENVGKTVRDAFWVSFIVGLSFACFLFFGAPWIYSWYGVPKELIEYGVPFLRIRAIGVFLTFLCLGLIGFLCGIKNTRVPMYLFMCGSTVFVLFDYLLVFGKAGFPALGLQGSAIASVAQYTVMFIGAFIYLMYHSDNKKYQINFFSLFDLKYARYIISLSWPIMLDKATMAAAYIWLCKMLCPMGTCAIATFCVIKDMERFAFLPAIAFAQVITFLVSNDYGTQNWQGIKSNIKKVCFLASTMVFCILVVFSLYPEFIVGLFDRRGEFGFMAVRIFPVLSILVFFDMIQLILSGALRGSGNVRIVMMVRLIICLCYFVPLSYILAHLQIEDKILQFILVYGSFYIGNALMSIAYVNRLRGEDWKVSMLQGTR